MKKLVFSCCLAFGLVQGDCWGMERDGVVHTSVLRSIEHSVGVKTFSNSDDEAEMISSTPIQNDEIQAAINKWAYLIPKNATTTQVNAAIIDAITHIESKTLHRSKMEALVNLICAPNVAKEYAYYVQNVYSCIAFEKCTSDNPYIYGKMLAAIGSDRGGGGGMDPALYWKEYEDGFYNLYLLVEHDESLDI